jgi:hypothetical protein
LWRRCAASGASSRTIEIISLLPPADRRRYVYGNGVEVHRGRAAFRDPLAFQVDKATAKIEFSAFFSQYQFGRNSGLPPLESLVHAYERNASLFVHPSVKFDHCFAAVSQLEGIWLSERPSLRLVGCRECNALVLASRLDTASPACPLCVWRDELRRSPRAALKCSTRPLAGAPNDLGGGFQQQAQFDLLVDELARFTPDRRVQAQLLAASPLAGLMDECWRRRASARSTRAIRIERLAENVTTTDLLQYSLALSAYRRLVEAGTPAYDAVIKAHAFIRDGFQFLKTLRPERVFDFIRQFDGARWGVETRLRLDVCPECQRDFVASLVDKTTPICPFCRLSRRPDLYLKKRWVGPKHHELKPNTQLLATWRATFLG